MPSESRWALWARNVVIVVAIASTIMSICYVVSERDGEPTVVDTYLFEDDEGVHVAVLESRWLRGGRGHSSTYFQLTVFDASTGELRGTLELTERERAPHLRAFRRVDHRLWTDSDLGLRVLDLRTAQPLLTHEEIVARVPELAAGFQISNETFNDYSPPTAGLPMVLADGRRAWLDMTPALHFEPVPTDPWRPGYFCGPEGGAKPSCERKECIAFRSVEGTTGMMLTEAPVWQESDMVQVNPGQDAAPSAEAPQPFLRPGLVRLHETECAIELSGDVLVLHDDRAVEPKQPLLTRARRDGGRVWTTEVARMLPPDHEWPQASPEPLEAQPTSDGLTVLLGERRTQRSLVVAVLDPETGEVRSSHVLVAP